MSSISQLTMASLIAPSKHSPVEDAEALQRAVKGNHTIHIFSFFLDYVFIKLSLMIIRIWLIQLMVD